MPSSPSSTLFRWSRGSAPNETEQNTIKEAYLSGSSLESLAAKHRISYNAVRKILRRNGVRFRAQGQTKRKLSRAIRDKIVADYQSGKSASQIGRDRGVTCSPISRVLRQEGIPGRSARESRPSFRLNETVFDVITPESAYWIGFLMADGCVHITKTGGYLLSVLLAKTDREHLERFRTFLGASANVRDYPVTRQTPKGVRHYEWVTFQVSSQKLCQALISYGVTPRKSRTARAVGLENNRDFWRGVIDGDGCLSWRKHRQGTLRLIGSLDLMTQFQTYCRTIYPSSTAKLLPKHTYNWTYHAACRHAYVLIQHFYYSGCAVALRRKLTIANEMLAHAATHSKLD